MSSFVMSKSEFVRVAGFCAGLADCENSFREPVLRIWNYSTNSVYTGEDFYKAFVWLFKLNALSVQLQYGDKEPEDDPDDYLEDFQEYRTKAAKAYKFRGCDIANINTLVQAIYKYHSFCECLLYQVEDRDCEQKIKGFIFRVMFQLMGILKNLSGHHMDGWEDFEL